MFNTPEFLQELTAQYPTHHLAPSLVLSSIRTKEGGAKFYAAVHTFPNGLNSRNVVCKFSHETYEGCLAGLALTWRTMIQLLNPSVEDSLTRSGVSVI
jgi:hypothetical protein